MSAQKFKNMSSHNLKCAKMDISCIHTPLMRMYHGTEQIKKVIRNYHLISLNCFRCYGPRLGKILMGYGNTKMASNVNNIKREINFANFYKLNILISKYR
jgi:hypothetical protein